MDLGNETSIDDVVGAVDRAHTELGAAHRRFLDLIAEVDRRGIWADDGARDLAQWLWMRYGISDWKARRFIDAGHALRTLPTIRTALDRGELGIDKVVELARFATLETEDGLASWARRVSVGTIRHEGDLARHPEREEAAADDAARSLRWSYGDEGRRFEMHADLPAAQGAVVATAIERVAATLPEMPGEFPGPTPARRADALVALSSAKLGADPDADRATVVIHARVAEPNSGDEGAAIDGGGVAHPSTLQRLLCAARVETVREDADGRVLEVGRITRVPPPWMLRQVRFRDGGCRFPGCGTKAFTQTHHIVFWRDGGQTDLDNLALLCAWHHKLVHEHGWWIKGSAQEELRWYRPDGTRYRAGPTAREEGPAVSIAG